MSNCFLILENIHNEQVRISANNIASYVSVGSFVEIVMVGGALIQARMDVSELDRILTELHFMIKTV